MIDRETHLALDLAGGVEGQGARNEHQLAARVGVHRAHVDADGGRSLERRRIWGVLGTPGAQAGDHRQQAGGHAPGESLHSGCFELRL